MQEFESQIDNIKKKSSHDLENKKNEIKNIKEELTKMNCEKGIISINLKSKDDSLKKLNEEITKLKEENNSLKAKIENDSKLSNEMVSNINSNGYFNKTELINSMPPSMYLNNDSSQMSREMSELDKQRKAKNAMQNKLQNNSKGFDLPASLRMGSS